MQCGDLLPALFLPGASLLPSLDATAARSHNLAPGGSDVHVLLIRRHGGRGSVRGARKGLRDVLLMGRFQTTKYVIQNPRSGWVRPYGSQVPTRETRAKEGTMGRRRPMERIFKPTSSARQWASAPPSNPPTTSPNSILRLCLGRIHPDVTAVALPPDAREA